MRLKSRFMKRKLVFLLLGVVLAGFSVRVYCAFHPSRAFKSHSPTDPWRTVDCIVTGFRSVSYDFRAYDLRVSPFEPILIGDLYWEGKYSTGDLFWSRDGTVAVASIVYPTGQRWAFACAYDFREHRAIRSSDSGSALDDSKDQEIRLLLESRGGFEKVVLPDFKEL